MFDWMEQKPEESEWDFISDMASLVVTIVFIAIACLAFLAGYWMVTQ